MELTLRSTTHSMRLELERAEKARGMAVRLLRSRTFEHTECRANSCLMVRVACLVSSHRS